MKPKEIKEVKIKCNDLCATLYVGHFDVDTDLLYVAIRRTGERKRHLPEVIIERKKLLEVLK